VSRISHTQFRTYQ